jgi:hypothetical protein
MQYPFVFIGMEKTMKSKTVLMFRNLLWIILLVTVAISVVAAFGQKEGMETAEFATQRIEKLRRTAKTLQELANQPLPDNLLPSEQKEAKRYAVWLKNAGQRLYDLADRWQADLNKAIRSSMTDPTTATKNMQEMNMSFNLQYLMLQNKISHENRQFSMVTNIMKNKHDTAKNSINNIR